MGLRPALCRRYSASPPPLQVERRVAGSGNAAPVGVVLQPKQSTLQGVTGHFWNSFSLLSVRPPPPDSCREAQSKGRGRKPVKLYLTSSSLIGAYYSRFSVVGVNATCDLSSLPVLCLCQAGLLCPRRDLRVTEKQRRAWRTRAKEEMSVSAAAAFISATRGS